VAIRDTRIIQRISGVASGAASESTSRLKQPHNLDKKQAGKPSAGNPPAGFDEAGAGNGFTVRLVRHSQRKRGATDRLNLRNAAPVLDPTRE
jgi:hypothetical protein